MVITCVSCHVILFVLLEMSIPYSQNENCRCFDIFTPKEQEILLKYRKEHFPEKILVPRERRLVYPEFRIQQHYFIADPNLVSLLFFFF